MWLDFSGESFNSDGQDHGAPYSSNLIEGHYRLLGDLSGLNPLHLHPGKLQVCGNFVFSYIGPYIRT